MATESTESTEKQISPQRRKERKEKLKLKNVQASRIKFSAAKFNLSLYGF
jgi:hypothetical protein